MKFKRQNRIFHNIAYDLNAKYSELSNYANELLIKTKFESSNIKLLIINFFILAF